MWSLIETGLHQLFRSHPGDWMAFKFFDPVPCQPELQGFEFWVFHALVQCFILRQSYNDSIS